MKYWLRCAKVEKGMFSDEMVVVVTQRNGTEEEFVVPKSEVNQKENLVTVDVFERDGVTWAVLPTNYSDSVPVDNQSLKPVDNQDLVNS